MKFLKAFLEEIMKVLIMGTIAIIAVNVYIDWVHEEKNQQMLIDVYTRDNTVHKI